MTLDTFDHDLLSSCIGDIICLANSLLLYSLQLNLALQQGYAKKFQLRTTKHLEVEFHSSEAENGKHN